MSNTSKDAKIQEKFEYLMATLTNQLPVQKYCYNQGQYIRLKDWPYTDTSAYPDQTKPVPQQLVRYMPKDWLDFWWKITVEERRFGLQLEADVVAASQHYILSFIQPLIACMFPYLDIFPRFEYSGPAQQAGDPRPVDRLDVAWMARKKGIIAAESFGNETCLLCIEYKRLGAMDLDDWSPAFTANNPEHGPFAPTKRNAVHICRQVCDYMKTRRSKRALIFDYRAMVLLAYPGETFDSVQTMNFTWIREVEGPQTTGNAASFRAMVLGCLVAAIHENKLDTGSVILPGGH